LIGLIAFFGIFAGDRFFSAYTLTLVMQQVAVVGILAAAQTLVVLTAGIDLAIGVIMVFSFVVMGNWVLTDGSPGDFACAVLALLAGFVVAGFWGFVNGNLVARLRLPPFIVTLGTWNIIMAICLIYSANETMREADLTAADPASACLRPELPRRTRRRHLRRRGDDRALRRALVHAEPHRLWPPHLCRGRRPRRRRACRDQHQEGPDRRLHPGRPDRGPCRLGLHRPERLVSPSTVVTDFNLQAITATVIGGISLFGGRGSILGVLFGTLIVGIMSMGLNMMNADPQWKVLLTGVLIIAAVAVDQWIRKVSA
jgi:fructose transport system permease protein